MEYMNYYKCPPIIHNTYPKSVINLYPTTTVRHKSRHIKKTMVLSLLPRSVQQPINESFVEEEEEEEEEEECIDIIPSEELNFQYNEALDESESMKQEISEEILQYKISLWREPGAGPLPTNVSIVAYAYSYDGILCTAIGNFDFIYISTNSGKSWRKASNQPRPQQWVSVSMSADGMKREAIALGEIKYISENSGETWTVE